MIKFHIGCSGFYYKHWKGLFYPDKLPQNKWFEYYCQHFNTLELNVTFYRFPQLQFLQQWYQKSNADFIFAVKAPREITHYKKFNDSVERLSDFYDVVREGLADKLGCILFQMPPSYHFTEDHLQLIINSLDDSFKNVVEFRHSSWWNMDVCKKLSKHHIIFCGMSYPGLPEVLVQNTDVVYYRLHGVPELYTSPYSINALQKLVDEIAKENKAKEVFFYFNNDIGGSAIKNARQMQLMVK
jgi:uncharacterized protein YecE (DUF72 family)